jgi:hypothetical protein
MKDRLTLTAIRRHGLVRGFAIAIVVLTIVPVTAPFATLDLTGFFAESPFHADSNGTKLVQEAVDLASVAQALDPSLSTTWRAVIDLVEPTTAQRFCPLVLRI